MVQGWRRHPVQGPASAGQALQRRPEGHFLDRDHRWIADVTVWLVPAVSLSSGQRDGAAVLDGDPCRDRHAADRRHVGSYFYWLHRDGGRVRRNGYR